MLCWVNLNSMATLSGRVSSSSAKLFTMLRTAWIALYALGSGKAKAVKGSVYAKG